LPARRWDFYQGPFLKVHIYPPRPFQTMMVPQVFSRQSVFEDRRRRVYLFCGPYGMFLLTFDRLRDVTFPTPPPYFLTMALPFGEKSRVAGVSQTSFLAFSCRFFLARLCRRISSQTFFFPFPMVAFFFPPPPVAFFSRRD